MSTRSILPIVRVVSKLALVLLTKKAGSVKMKKATLLISLSPLLS